MVDALYQAARSLRRQPAFSGSVVAIMALGIGACTAMFSIIVVVFFDPLPYAEPERLAIIRHAQGDTPGTIGLSPSDYVTYRDTTRAFASVAAIGTRGYNLGGDAQPIRVTCGRVTPNLFLTLGVGASRGRWIAEDDDTSGRRVVVLTHHLWHAYFGGDEAIVGRDILLDAVPYTVIGVMPASFGFPPSGIQGVGEAACWIPASFSAAELATPAFDFLVLARLAAGVSIEQAADDASRAARRIWEAYPAEVKSQVQLRARLAPLAEHVVAGSRTRVLQTWGIRVKRGRAFEPGDAAGPLLVAVVNETMARTYWPGVDVVGRQMSQVGNPQPITIVGVIADVTQRGPSTAPAPAFHVPLAQATRPAPSLAFAVRTSGDAQALAEAVRQIVSDSDPTLPVFAMQSGEELLASSVTTQRFAMLTAVALGVLALVLATTGLYAVIAFMVSQSMREYGIRIALGATRPAVVGLVTGRALRLVAAGIVVGVAASVSLSRLIVSLLFGVQPGDPVTYALVALLLTGAGAAAVAVPVARAMRVDPAECLRSL